MNNKAIALERCLTGLRLGWFAATALAAAAASAEPAQLHERAELRRWQQEAQRVEIIRDNYGVPHIYGKSDADAVFGMLYAQAEDDFDRIEMNYINAMGRAAEVEGESALYRDLRMKLFIDPVAMQANYASSPVWLKKLMNSFADGLNYYLYTHPSVHPKLLTHFEPWMALCFSEGSIGGDIESVELGPLQQMYGAAPAQISAALTSTALTSAALRPVGPPEPGGSNGFAIAPSLSASKHALLWINPHTSFYFRPELQVVSREGLYAYGAVTWGQFFVYQGFNKHLGWMHTSGGGNVITEYLETVLPGAAGDPQAGSQPGSQHYSYRYGEETRPLKALDITLPYKTSDGMATRVIKVFYSHHGPIVRRAGDKWVAVRLMQEPVKALMQSYLRTKARNYTEFRHVMELRTNSSNNTVYADADGNIAYFHGNFIPRRSSKYDWNEPVDGADPGTEWQGLHNIDETITLFNPPNGWIMNTNNWPFSAAGAYSPQRKNYPDYMWVYPENARGIHAQHLLERQHDMTLDSLIKTAYDPALPAFDVLIPALLRACDSTPDADPLKASLTEQIAVLRAWDRRFAVDSVATSLAIYWAQDLMRKVEDAARAQKIVKPDWQIFAFTADHSTPAEQLASLAQASSRLTADFGNWKTPWGEINRFQRLSGAIDLQYDDSKPSLPVPYVSSLWGSLAAFGATRPSGTKRIYGDRGNSFVAAVEFGPRIKAKSILAGGESGDPESAHFIDQAQRYARGDFKDVWFYREDIEQHLERRYHPGE